MKDCIHLERVHLGDIYCTWYQWYSCICVLFIQDLNIKQFKYTFLVTLHAEVCSPGIWSFSFCEIDIFIVFTELSSCIYSSCCQAQSQTQNKTIRCLHPYVHIIIAFAFIHPQSSVHLFDTAYPWHCSVFPLLWQCQVKVDVIFCDIV